MYKPNPRNLAILQALNKKIAQIIPALENAVWKMKVHPFQKAPSALWLISYELQMVLLNILLKSKKVTLEEIEFYFDYCWFFNLDSDDLINKSYSLEDRLIAFNDTLPNYRESILGNKTIFKPTIKALQRYDSEYSTNFADSAKEMIFNFAESFAKADGRIKTEEKLVLDKLKEALYPSEKSLKFEAQIIGITGYSSILSSLDTAMRGLIEAEGGKVTGDEDALEWREFEETVLVGDVDFSKDYLINCIITAQKQSFTPFFISIEDFLDYYTDDFEPYYEGDPRIKRHAGLAFLASLYFKFPTVDILGYGINQNAESGEWNFESILRANFGYSVKKGISKSERRMALERAVKSPKVITLKQIADQIVFNINLRKGQKHMKPAIERWMEDLEWLKENFYSSSIHSFKLCGSQRSFQFLPV